MTIHGTGIHLKTGENLYFDDYKDLLIYLANHDDIKESQLFDYTRIKLTEEEKIKLVSKGE